MQETGRKGTEKVPEQRPERKENLDEEGEWVWVWGGELHRVGMLGGCWFEAGQRAGPALGWRCPAAKLGGLRWPWSRCEEVSVVCDLQYLLVSQKSPASLPPK